MRVIEPAMLLVLCVGCGDGDHHSSKPRPDTGLAGAAGDGASAGESSGENLGGSPEAQGGAPAVAGAKSDGGDAGEGGSGDEPLLPDEPDNGILSGSRLKAEWFDFDGTRVFADFYDTELESPCTPGVWSDGKTYCIPVSTASQGYTTDKCEAADMLGHVYANAACPQPPPSYLVLATQGSQCGASTAHVYRLSATAATLTEYFASQNGGCAGPFSNGFNSESYPVTAEVMAAELVELTREAPADPGRYSRQYLVASDGARLAIAPYDSELDADCTLESNIADKSKGSCPPTDRRDAVYFSDMDCKQGLVSAATACPKPAFTRQLADRTCAQGASSYYKVGDAVKVPDVFVGGSTICRATTASGGTTLYAQGEPVDVPAMARAHDAVAGRNLQSFYFSDGQKRYLDPNRLYDTGHDVECQVNVLPDGSAVCVPNDASVSGFYGDDTCSTIVHVGLVYFGADRCDQPKLPPFLINPGVAAQGCGPNYEVRERGALHKGMPYLMGAMCEIYSGLEIYHLYELGPVRPFSEFPAATKVRDK